MHPKPLGPNVPIRVFISIQETASAVSWMRSSAPSRSADSTSRKDGPVRSERGSIPSCLPSGLPGRGLSADQQLLAEQIQDLVECFSGWLSGFVDQVSGDHGVRLRRGWNIFEERREPVGPLRGLS
jgi:hypothetical protein